MNCVCFCHTAAWIRSVQFSVSAVAYSLRPRGPQHTRFPVHHQLSELAQTRAHWVGDAIQPSHPLSFPSSAFSISQNQGLFQWVSSSHPVAKVLDFQLQHQSFQWIFRVISFRIDWLDLLAVQETLKSLLQNYSSKVSILWCSAFQLECQSNSHIHTWLLEKP